MTKKSLPVFAMALTGILLFNCSSKPDRPKLTMSEYSLQATTAKGVVTKITNETDFNKMHAIALAVESSRSVECISVGEECNVLGKILNKIVSATSGGKAPIEEENVAIYKLMNQLNEEFQVGEKLLEAQWIEYDKAQKT